MISLQDINSTIMSGSFTNNDLNSILMAVKYRRAQMAQEVKRQLNVGDRVEFYSTKQSRTLQGAVEKVAIKYVTVATGQGRWKVPANMLEVI